MRHLDHVQILGFVQDLADLYQTADLVVVPLRGGAGTRIKILEALSYGRCVVSTTVGAEGLAITSGAELVLADTPATFAAACVALLEDPVRARAMAQNGQEFRRRSHAPEALRRALADALATPA